MTRLADGLEIPPHRWCSSTGAASAASSSTKNSQPTRSSFTVTERGLLFEVNLTSYLDTGLFLDHRDTRQMIRERAPGQGLPQPVRLYRQLHGVRGGRWRPTHRHRRYVEDLPSMESPQPGAQRARRPRAPQLRAVRRARVSRTHAARRAHCFDLIVLDPPSFSNSKRMDDTFDVQRDQAEPAARPRSNCWRPVANCSSRTTARASGSTPACNSWPRSSEISKRTIPLDFKRHSPHRCWVLQKT